MNPFKKAAKSLPGKWYKGEYSDGKGNYCAAGHLFLALGYTDEEINSGAADDGNKAIFDKVLEPVCLEWSNGQTRFVSEINDDPETTEADIVTLLEKAAIRYDEIKDLTYDEVKDLTG